MGLTQPVVVAILGLLASEAFAQETPQPPALELPMGARVRVQTQASGQWIKGVLAGADAATISLVPEGAPPLGANQIRLPAERVIQLEIVTGRKSQWLSGLLIGTAAGVALGFGMDVDPVQCEFDADYFCNRGSAVAAMGATSAAIGLLVGKLIKKDVWTPVALDALGPPPGHVTRAGLGLQAVPGGLALELTFHF